MNRNKINIKKALDLTTILEEAGYDHYGESYFSSLHIRTYLDGQRWQEGRSVFTTYEKSGASSNEALYRLWGWNGSGSLKKVLAKIGDKALIVQSLQELDGAVKAYDSLRHRCLVVPRLELNRWIYDLYLEAKIF